MEGWAVEGQNLKQKDLSDRCPPGIPNCPILGDVDSVCKRRSRYQFRLLEGTAEPETVEDSELEKGGQR